MNYRPIGFGEADIELEREYGLSKKGLVKSPPPLAQSVYVCGWCYSIVDPQSLNWTDDDVYVCNSCAKILLPSHEPR